MNRKYILQAVTVLSLTLSSAWVRADTDNRSALLTESPASAEVVVAGKSIPGDGKTSVSRLSAKTAEGEGYEESGRVIDCYYEYNDSNLICQEAKSNKH